jgi:hypothetical protein
MYKSRQVTTRHSIQQSEGESPLAGIISLVVGVGLLVFIGSLLLPEVKLIMAQIEQGYKP